MYLTFYIFPCCLLTPSTGGPNHNNRFLRRLHRERFHFWPLLERLWLGLRRRRHWTETRDHSWAIGYSGIFRCLRPFHELRNGHCIEVRVQYSIAANDLCNYSSSWHVVDAGTVKSQGAPSRKLLPSNKTDPRFHVSST